MYVYSYIGVLCTFFSLPLVYGYGYKMHSYLGKLTDNYLSLSEPILYNKVLALLDGEKIETISSWADKVKRNKQYTWTKELHYIDILECSRTNYTKDVVDKYCENNCIVSALQDFTNSIKYNADFEYIKGADSLTKSELLKFLIHFIQDFSQPMHLLGYDRGGNSFKVNIYMDGRNKTTNLHFMWDSLLPEFYVKNNAYLFNNDKIQTPDNYYDVIDYVLNTNLKNVACKIYPDSHYIIFNDYFNEDYFKLLFDNYRILVVSTLKYIFE